MIKVLVVDDSLIQRALLEEILNSDPNIKVIATAGDGEEAVEKALSVKPDVITMDIHLPKMSGIEATRKIMSIDPVPIVIISGSTTDTELSGAFEALEAGAVAISEKINYASNAKGKLIETIKLMSEVKVIKRHPHLRKDQQTKKNDSNKLDSLKIEVIGIGVSTGGPPVLQEIFKNLPANFPPILVVQHITPGFLKGLVDWLNQTTNINVKVAVLGENPVANQIYLAPEGFHMGLDHLQQIVLNKDQPENGHRPSASFLFRSLANTMGKKALGILLTGMGHDGAQGLKQMRDSGAYTIAQDKDSCTIYGMPGEAVALGAAIEELSPLEIADFIKNQVRSKK